MDENLNGVAFYACFVNGDKRDSVFPFFYHNEYELVNMGVVDPFLHHNKALFTPDAKCSWFAGKNTFDSVFETFERDGVKGESFIQEKGQFTGNQQIYYVDVSIVYLENARGFGEYNKWYKITFSDQGSYSCMVSDYSSPTKEFFKETQYRCDIENLPKDDNDFILELYKVYPDGKHINYQPFKALPPGQRVNQFCVLHCNRSIYLCVEFYDNNDMPVGLFDMGYNEYISENYQDIPGINWGNRVPFTVIISHFHQDHVNGLKKMVASHNAPGTAKTYQYFFSNMVLFLTDTIQPPSFTTIIQTISGAGGIVYIYPSASSSNVVNHNFGFGKVNFNHPTTGGYDPHPHLHGLYVCCTTNGGRRVMIAGDTVYRGMDAADRAGPYNVLVGCHHGGEYAVNSSGHHYPAGETKERYIPTPARALNTVIYSSNGDGTGPHPHPTHIRAHVGRGWNNGVITNAALTTYGTIPPYVVVAPDGVTVL